MSNYGQVYATAKMSSARNVARLEKRLMKRSLKQKFKDWLFDDRPEQANSDIRIDEDSIQLSRDRSLKFEVHNASGGRVVQTRRYDSQKDRHFENLYIITNDQEFGREIDKIITMEFLK
jgi:Tfp pilus assembly protein FimV